MTTMQQLETALINADKAGDMDAARQLAAVIQRARQDPANQIPEADVQETIQRPEEPTAVQQVVGAGDALLSSVPMAAAGSLGMIGGTLKGLAEQLLSGQFGTQQAADAVERSAMQGAETFAAPFAPETQAGRDILQGVGEALAPAVAATPFGAELGAIAGGVRAAAPLVRGAAADVTAPITQAASKITEAARPATAEAQSGARSGGSAAVEAGTLRQARAEELPVPIKLTEGQKTRDFGQQRFERETAKDPEMGEPIRQFNAEQNMKLQQNLESFIDSTGAETADLRSVGQSVDKALRSRLARDKSEVRSLYKDFEKSGEADTPADISPLADYLNKNRAERTEGGIMNKLGRQFDVLEVGNGDFKDGSLKLKPMTLGQSEAIRRFINKNTDQADSTDIRIATELKNVIDDATREVGGPIIKRARAARARMANDYERVGLVKALVGKKGRSNDRAIALEDVLNRSIIGPSASLDDVRQVRRLLQTEGPSGQQAWKELQGATLNYIKDEALKNVARDQQGNAIISPAQLDRAIQKLDKNGKLDFVFGKKGAEMLRTVNDVAKDVLVAPPGAVNTSNTASVLAGLMDVAISGTSGVPAPVMTTLRLMTKNIKDRKTRARVRKALGVTKKEDE